MREVPVNTETTRVVTAQAAAPVQTQVAGVSTTKELPKTGLPALAWAAAAFVPAGFRLKRFGKSQQGFESASYLWEERQFKSGA